MHVALVGAEFEENLAVRYLQGALEHAGHRVTSVIFNDTCDTERAAGELVSSGAELAGFSMVFTYRAREFASVATRARELGFAGHMIAGGHFAAMHPEPLLRDVAAFDSVGCGEGEEMLCALASHLTEPGLVRGLVHRQGGTIVRNPAAEKPADLDVLPYPPRKSPFDEYLGIPITNILSSRGCSHRCAFCSIAAWHQLCGGDRLRLRAPEKLADEMAWLYRQGVRIFNFHDDNFVLDDRAAMLGRTRELGRALEERGAARHIAFAIKCRPDAVDRELFSKLREMGLFRVFLGVEAGTEESLRALGRGQRLRDNVRALEILNDLDIHTCFNLLVLNPESTLEDLAANVAFLRAHPRNAMNFCRTEIYAGTPLERRLRRDGRLLGDYWGYDYVIRDPRAQLAFDLIYPAFEARNYGDAGLHHLTMQIDYEQQLLRAFFGANERLRARAKKMIVEVNVDTCDHLDYAIAKVPALRSPRDIEAFGEELRGRVARSNDRLGERVRELLDEIRLAPGRPARRKAPRAWLRAAASAGLAATVTLASTGCREKSHPTEMAPAPTPTTSGPPPVDAGPSDALDGADADAAAEETPPAGPAALIKPAVSEALLPFLAERVKPAEIVELELWIGRDGKVTKAIVHRPGEPTDRADAIRERAERLEFADPHVRGQRFVVYFGAAEVAGAGADAASPPPPPPPATTHMKERVPPRPEMAPRPPNPPPRAEMAPERTRIK